MADFDDVQKKLQDASLEESRALNELLLAVLEKDREERRKTRRVSIICATVCLVAVLAFFAVIGVVMVGGIQIETSTVTETITQDSGEGGGNNVFMSGEHATYDQGAGD